MIKMKKYQVVRLLWVALLGSLAFVCLAQPAAPRVSIEIVKIDNADHVRLSWESVEEAESYNIYVSNDSYTEDWGEPLTTVGEGITEYIIEDPLATLGNYCFFQVKAYTASQLPDWLVLVDGDQFNGYVSIDPFYISKYEVTQSDFVDVMGEWDFHFGGNPTHPAEKISWYNAIEYCNRLSIREGLTPTFTYNGRSNPDDWYDQWPGWDENDDNQTNVSCDWEADGYRLPTEAEWNHAANAGIYPPQFNYSGSMDVDEVAWYQGNAGRTTHPIGELLPNGLGIYDMSGNVLEWCWDRYDSNTFPSGGDNPHGPDGDGTYRVMRGGCWISAGIACTVSARCAYNVTHYYNYLGFRCVRRID